MYESEALLAMYTPSDRERVGRHLAKLLKHVDPENLALVGGIPIRYFASQAKMKFPRRPTNDLDAIVREQEAIPTSVTDDFLVSHYHTYTDPQQLDRWYVVLVDPETKTKIDIFDWQMYPPQELVTVPFGSCELQMRSPEDQLATATLEATRVLNGTPMDRKKQEDIGLLVRVSDMQKASGIYDKMKGNRTDHPYFTLSEVQSAIRAAIESNPGLLVDHVHRKKRPYKCQYCTEAPGFPIAQMEEVYELLGYIE